MGPAVACMPRPGLLEPLPPFRLRWLPEGEVRRDTRSVAAAAVEAAAAAAAAEEAAAGVPVVEEEEGEGEEEEEEAGGWNSVALGGITTGTGRWAMGTSEGLPMPSWPTALTPHAYSTPPRVSAKQWAPPRDRETTFREGSPNPHTRSKLKKLTAPVRWCGHRIARNTWQGKAKQKQEGTS